MTSENYLFRVEGNDLQPVEVLTVPPMFGALAPIAEERLLRVASEAARVLSKRLPEETSQSIVIALWYASGAPIGYYQIDFFRGLPAITGLSKELRCKVEPESMEDHGRWTAYLANLADLHNKVESVNQKYQVAMATIDRLNEVNSELNRKVREADQRQNSWVDNIVSMVEYKDRRTNAV